MVLFSAAGGRENVIESAVAKYFLSMDFKVIDPEMVRRELEKELPKGSSPSAELIMKTGARYGAEILVLGILDNSISKFTINNVEMRFNRVNASARAIKIDTGELIASDNELRSGPGMEDAIKRMSDEAGQAIAKKLLNQVIDRWSNELANTVMIKIFASGLKTYNDLNAFKQALAAEAKGVRQLYQRYYSNNDAEIDVEMRGNAQGLADDMAAMKINGMNVQVTEISQNRVAVKIISTNSQEGRE
jgi:ribosomal protein L28